MGCYAWSPAWRQLAAAIGFVSLGLTLSVSTLLPNHREPAFAENMPVITQCVIQAAASWVAWCAVHSVGPSLED